MTNHESTGMSVSRRSHVRHDPVGRVEDLPRFRDKLNARDGQRERRFKWPLRQGPVCRIPISICHLRRSGLTVSRRRMAEMATICGRERRSIGEAYFEASLGHTQAVFDNQETPHLKAPSPDMAKDRSAEDGLEVCL